MKKIMNKFAFTLLAAGAMAVGSCTTEDLNPSLEQNKEGENAVETTGDLEVILKGAYDRMTSSSYYGRDYIVTNEVRTPNTYANGSSGRFTTEAGFAYSPNGLYIWNNAYAVIASANIIINADIEAMSDFADNEADALHMVGQAYAIRALAHFDLVKVFGQEHVEGNLGVPYMLEFKGDDMIPARETLDQNRAQLFSDIQTAYDMMQQTGSVTRMTKLTAKAIESRMAVWFGMWPEARDAAFEVIDSGEYAVAGPEEFLVNFTRDGGENMIFELAFDETDNAGINGLEYIYRGSSYGDIAVTPNAVALFEDSDVRGLNEGPSVMGIETFNDGSSYVRNMAKYPDRSSNVPVVRYEEVILNYAEALFELGEGDPLTWLNMIPENRGATPYAEVTKENILEERRKEFMFEGLYFFDLLRTGRGVEKIDTEQNVEASVPYGDTRLVHPIPFAELDANSNMTQNPGYPG